MARRKRLRNNPRDEWEFDLLQEDEAEGLNGGAGGGRTAGAGKRGARNRRAGELYDAFAAGSEDEYESEGEYEDDVGHQGAAGVTGVVEGGDEREKRLYESDEDTSEEQHVIGDDESADEEELNEKSGQGEGLLRR